MDDEAAIRRLLARYCHTLDDGDVAGFGALWAGDAELAVRGTVLRGREAIRDTVAGRQPPERRGRHLTVNVEADVDGDAARAVSDFVFYARADDGTPKLRFVGRYHDDLVRDGGEWQFRRRAIEFF